MLGFLRTRLVVKLALLIGLTVGAGFAVLAAGSAQIEAHAVEDMHRESARAIATSLAAGVRNSMLTGNGVAVRELLDDAKTGLGTADVRVFAPSGEEVFGRKPPAPPPDQQPAHVRAVLTSRAPASAGDARATPIENEARCRSCHGHGDLRGVLTLGTKGARVPIDDSDVSLDALATIARSAFVQIMTAKHEDGLDEFFAELTKSVPGIRGVAVYNTLGERKYGGRLGISDEGVSRGTEDTPAFTESKGDLRYRAIPLPNEKRCQGCHDPRAAMRGAIVVAFAPVDLDATRTLAAAATISLDHVMLSGLGRMITGFMDDVAHTGVVTTLSVHDDEGRLYHDAFAKYEPPSAVGTVLRSGKLFEAIDAPGRPEFLFVDPLPNDTKCQRCHGPDLPLRGAIQIKLDTSKEIATVRVLRDRSVEFAVLTIVFALVLLWLVLRTTVLGPVQRIGRVAERVGEGDFEARVSVHSGDEMGRLGTRINEMVKGLREKLALSKFVSRETLRTVESVGTTGAMRGGGVRQRVTMLFSDLRGFTSFSETRKPEDVVAMLNEYLQVQVDVVSQHGGDVDKFVGDELMARFTGKDAEARATHCAVRLIAAVAALEAKASHGLAVGVGVNAGEVVLGSMGAEHRLDFTVIGDAVNLAARLCSVAKGAEVLITRTIRDALEGDDLVVEELVPIRVKGKAEPIPIFRVTGRGAI
jgi:class 3 adenylate cyclase